MYVSTKAQAKTIEKEACVELPFFQRRSLGLGLPLSLSLSFFGETKTLERETETKTLEKGLDRGGFYESEGRYLGARITSVEMDCGRWMVFGRCEPLD